MPETPEGFTELKSTNLHAVGFKPSPDPEKAGLGTLEVMFKNGGLYAYEGVPQAMHKEIQEAESAGRYFAQMIKQNPSFKCVKVEEQ